MKSVVGFVGELVFSAMIFCPNFCEGADHIFGSSCFGITPPNCPGSLTQPKGGSVMQTAVRNGHWTSHAGMASLVMGNSQRATVTIKRTDSTVGDGALGISLLKYENGVQNRQWGTDGPTPDNLRSSTHSLWNGSIGGTGSIIITVEGCRATKYGGSAKSDTGLTRACICKVGGRTIKFDVLDGRVDFALFTTGANTAETTGFSVDCQIEKYGNYAADEGTIEEGSGGGESGGGGSGVASTYEVVGPDYIRSGQTGSFKCNKVIIQSGVRSAASVKSWKIITGSQYATISSGGVIAAKDVSTTQRVKFEAIVSTKGSDLYCVQGVDIVPACTVSVTSSASSVFSGESCQCTFKASRKSGTVISCTPSWSIASGSAYATISSSGRVTAKSVTESHDVTVKASCTIDGYVETACRVITIKPLSGKPLPNFIFGKLSGWPSSLFVSKTKNTDEYAIATALSSVNKGDVVYVMWGVQNSGTLKASGGETCAYYFDGVYENSIVAPSAYDLSKVRWFWCRVDTSKMSVGTHTVKVVINPASVRDRIVESSYADNEKSVTFTVSEPPPSVYTVRFNKNDGSGTTATQTFTCGVAQCLKWKDSQLKWSRAGYTFLGWAIDGSGLVKYANGEKVKDLAAKDATKQLYAVWGNAYSYTVVFHRNYSSSDTTTARQRVWRNVSTSLAWKDSGLGWANPSGRAFLGWALTAGGSAEHANGAKICNIAGGGKTIHLYARWSTATYTVKFNKNDGSGETATQAFKVGVAQRLRWKDSGLKWSNPSGWKYLGWATNSTATVAQYANGQCVQDLAAAGKTVVLYAVWRRPAGKNVYINATAAGGTFTSESFSLAVAGNYTFGMIDRPAWVTNIYTRITYRGGSSTLYGTSYGTLPVKALVAGSEAVTTVMLSENTTGSPRTYTFVISGPDARSVIVTQATKSASKSSTGAAGVCALSVTASTPAPSNYTFNPGLYRGTFADGSGTFDLLVDEFDADGVATAYLVATTEDGSWSEECEATVAGGVLMVTVNADAGTLVYCLSKKDETTELTAIWK